MTIYKKEESKDIIRSHYDDILERWPISYKSRMVETRYGNTHILEMGDGDELLVLLHGSTSNSGMWIGEVADLNNYKILAIDIPGEPNRSTEERLDLEDDSFSLWLDDCMKHYDAPFHLVGNSLGGWVALKYAVTYPDKLRSLILLAPSGLAPARISFVFKTLIYLTMGKKGIKKMTSLAMGTKEVPKEVCDVTEMMMSHFNPRMGSLPTFDDEALKKLSMPVLYMAGSKDKLLQTQKSADRVKVLIPTNDIRIMDRGHALFDIGKELAEYLESV